MVKRLKVGLFEQIRRGRRREQEVTILELARRFVARDASANGARVVDVGGACTASTGDAFVAGDGQLQARSRDRGPGRVAEDDFAASKARRYAVPHHPNPRVRRWPVSKRNLIRRPERASGPRSQVRSVRFPTGQLALVGVDRLTVPGLLLRTPRGLLGIARE